MYFGSLLHIPFVCLISSELAFGLLSSVLRHVGGCSFGKCSSTAAFRKKQINSLDTHCIVKETVFCMIIHLSGVRCTVGHDLS